MSIGWHSIGSCDANNSWDSTIICTVLNINYRGAGKTTYAGGGSVRVFNIQIVLPQITTAANTLFVIISVDY